MAARYIDNHGYERGQLDHSDLIHRQVAYHEVYLRNRHLYPEPFRSYQIHHVDGDKRNNEVSNLQIVTKKEHERIHRKANPLKIIAIIFLLFILMQLLLFSAALLTAHR